MSEKQFLWELKILLEKYKVTIERCGAEGCCHNSYYFSAPDIIIYDYELSEELEKCQEPNE